MSWTTGVQKTLSPQVQALLKQYGTPLGIVKAWQDAKANLDVWQAHERALRVAAFDLMFEAPTEGVNRVDLSDGYSLKASYPYSYKLTNKEAATEKALDAITEISQQAGFIADRLVKWEPEISIKEYKALNPGNPAAQSPEQKAILALLAPVLTIKPGMPQFEIEVPKGK